jgi:flagellar hook-associated protein 3 FlgL
MADRVSSYWIYQRPVNDMMRLQSALNKTSEQVSTGKGMLSPSDDPVGAARVLQLDQEIGLMGQFQRNISLVEARLQTEEGVLTAVTSTLQRVRDLTVQAANSAVLTGTERGAIAQEIKEKTKELFGLANSQDGSGEYLFSGFAGDQQTFVENPGGGYRYQGDEGVRHVQISNRSTLASGDTGKDLFLDIPANKPSFYAYASSQNEGQPAGVISQGITLSQTELDAFYPEDAVITFENELDVQPSTSNFTVRRKSDGRVVEGLEHINYQPGRPIQFGGMSVNIVGSPEPGDKFVVESSHKQGMLVTMDKLMYALTNYGTEPEFTQAYDDAMFNTLDNLDAALDNVSEVRARIGARLNSAENINNQHADNTLAAQSIRSDITDLDYAEAISRLQLEEFTLQAAQQSFAKITQTKLFDFI